MDPLLKTLRSQARLDDAELASLLDLSEAEVAARIADYEERGIIRGYQAILNEDELDGIGVTALIEVKLEPQRDGGFDRSAARVSKFAEVSSAFLVSGNFDLLLFVEGETLQDVAQFVAEKLATVPGVTSTATHFMLRTYKHRGVLMTQEEGYERLKVSP